MNQSVRLKYIPNFYSIVWIIICVKLSLSPFFGFISAFDYLLWGVTVLQFVLKNNWRHFPAKKLEDILGFLVLALVQVVGLIQNHTVLSVRNIIAVLVIAMFMADVIWSGDKIQIEYFRAFGLLLLGVMALATRMNLGLQNTIPGCLVFLFAGYLAMELSIRSKKVSVRDPFWVLAAVLLVLVAGIVFLFKARTALAVLLLVVCFYFVLEIFGPSPRQVRSLFYWIIWITILGTVFYINITKFSWYATLNTYSRSLFGKNIDSSRPALWQSAIDGMTPLQMLFGKGTGTLPDMERYAVSSFHNAFIQIFVQNGFIGLWVLIYILKTIWFGISEAARTKAGKLFISVLFGVIVYNSFECTLLQNKLFLGFIQWFILAVGIRFAREFRRKESR